MANTDNAFGLKPIKTLGGAAGSGQVNRYFVDAGNATAIYVGGLVKPSGSGDANGVMGVISMATTGDAVVGVVVGVEAVTADSTQYRVGSTARYVFVADDPDQLFEVQEDGTSAVTACGNTADLTGITGGSTVYGNSTMEIDTSTQTATGDGTQDVTMISLAQRADNEVGANSKWVVRLNNHFFTDAAAGA